MLDNGPHLSPWDVLSLGTFCPLGRFVCVPGIAPLPKAASISERHFCPPSSVGWSGFYCSKWTLIMLCLIVSNQEPAFQCCLSLVARPQNISIFLFTLVKTLRFRTRCEVRSELCLAIYTISKKNCTHRIIDDRMENSVNRRQIQYNLR